MERKEFNPFEQLSPIEYQRLLIPINLNYQDKLRGFLNDKLGRDLSEVCLILTGSDGKLERHCQSETELIIIGNDQSLVSEMREKVGGLFNKSVFHIDMGDPKDNLPEGRIVGETLSYAYNNPDLPYPDRILHSQLLLGSVVIYQQAVLKVLNEIQTKRRIYRHTQEQCRNYRKALGEGVYRRQTIFSWEEGIQYYYESKDPKLLRFGFKLGPIRAVQRKLDLITFKALRNDEQLREEIIKRYLRGLSNTMERIEFLTEISLIPKDLKDKLIEAYYWFLQQYHRAQDFYKNTRRLVELPFNVDLGANYRRIIEEFLDTK